MNLRVHRGRLRLLTCTEHCRTRRGDCHWKSVEKFGTACGGKTTGKRVCPCHSSGLPVTGGVRACVFSVTTFKLSFEYRGGSWRASAEGGVRGRRSIVGTFSREALWRMGECGWRRGWWGAWWGWRSGGGDGAVVDGAELFVRVADRDSSRSRAARGRTSGRRTGRCCRGG